MMGMCAMDWGGSGGKIVHIEDMYNAGAAAIYLALTTNKSDLRLRIISLSTLNTFD